MKVQTLGPAILLAVVATAARPPTCPAAELDQAGMFASLAVQILPIEEGVQVSQSLRVSGPGEAVRFEFPLLVPAGIPGPSLEPRSEQNPGGIDVRASGGASVEHTGSGILVKGSPGPSGDFTVQVRYALRVEVPRATFNLAPATPIQRVQVMTRRDRAFGLHVRPLAPYAYREEVEEDGTWQYLVLQDGIGPGKALGIAVSHLPAPFGPYRAVALGVAAVALVVLGLAMGRGRARPAGE